MAAGLLAGLLGLGLATAAAEPLCSQDTGISCAGGDNCPTAANCINDYCRCSRGYCAKQWECISQNLFNDGHGGWPKNPEGDHLQRLENKVDKLEEETEKVLEELKRNQNHQGTGGKIEIKVQSFDGMTTVNLNVEKKATVQDVKNKLKELLHIDPQNLVLSWTNGGVAKTLKVGKETLSEENIVQDSTLRYSNDLHGYEITIKMKNDAHKDPLVLYFTGNDHISEVKDLIKTQWTTTETAQMTLTFTPTEAEDTENNGVPQTLEDEKSLTDLSNDRGLKLPKVATLKLDDGKWHGCSQIIVELKSGTAPDRMTTKIVLHVDASDKIEDVKNQIKDRLSIEPEKQQLTYQPAEGQSHEFTDDDNDKTLTELQITQNSVLQLIDKDHPPTFMMTAASAGPGSPTLWGLAGALLLAAALGAAHLHRGRTGMAESRSPLLVQ